MYTNINFLKEQARLQELELVRDRKIALITSIFLGVFLAVTIGIFSYRFYVNLRLQNILSAQDSANAQLAGMQNLENSYTQLNTTLQSVKKVVTGRAKKWDAIAYFYQVLPQNSTIHEVTLDVGGGTLSFSVQSKDVFAVNTLLALLQSNVIKNGGYSPSLGSLYRSTSGEYVQSVVLHITSATPAPKVIPAPIQPTGS